MQAYLFSSERNSNDIRIGRSTRTSRLSLSHIYVNPLDFEVKSCKITVRVGCDQMLGKLGHELNYIRVLHHT